MIVTTVRNKALLAIRLFKDAFNELMINDPLRMAGATAFFTTFALPPILVILIQILKLFIGPRSIRSELFRTLTEIVGPEAVRQLVDVLRAFRKVADNWYITIGGFIFLLFVATTLFTVIKNSINQVWKIRPMRSQGVIRKLRSRLKAVIVIAIAGIFIGSALGKKIQGGKLKKGFGWFVLVMGIYIIVKELFFPGASGGH